MAAIKTNNLPPWKKPFTLTIVVNYQAAQPRLIANIAGAMQSVPDDIKRRQITHFSKADPACGAGVAAKLGIKI